MRCGINEKGGIVDVLLVAEFVNEQHGEVHGTVTNSRIWKNWFVAESTAV